MVPDQTFLRPEAENIVCVGPESGVRVELYGQVAWPVSSSALHFHVIAAPRPSGLPDLDRIQARAGRGALFCVAEPLISHLSARYR